MRRKLALRSVAAIASSVMVASALSLGAIAPAQAATKSTVTLLSTADISSLNSSTSDGNTSYNALSGSLTGMGFWYYNSDAKLVMNPKFGTMKVVKQAPKDFRIQYTSQRDRHGLMAHQLMLKIFSFLTSLLQINTQRMQVLAIHLVMAPRRSIALAMAAPTAQTLSVFQK